MNTKNYYFNHVYENIEISAIIIKMKMTFQLVFKGRNVINVFFRISNIHLMLWILHSAKCGNDVI